MCMHKYMSVWMRSKISARIQAKLSKGLCQGRSEGWGKKENFSAISHFYNEKVFVYYLLHNKKIKKVYGLYVERLSIESQFLIS